MPYTFVPKNNYVKAYIEAQKVSKKNIEILCKIIRKKSLKRSKSFLENLIEGKETLNGKTYNNSAEELINIIKSCEKNAEYKGLDMENMLVHASVHKGRTIRRRRRKSSYGNKIKTANIEIMLIEKNSPKPNKKIEEKEVKEPKESKEVPKGSKEVPKESKETKEVPKKEVPKQEPKKETKEDKKNSETESDKTDKEVKK